MSGNKPVVLLKRLKPLAGVQGAVEIRPLEFLEKVGVVFCHDRQFGALQDFEPLPRVAGKDNASRAMLELFAERSQFVAGMDQRRGFYQSFDGVDHNSMPERPALPS